MLYSALGSFYIPSCIMVFVYIRIYFAARARARRAVRKPPKAKAHLASIEDHHAGLPATPTTKSTTSMAAGTTTVDTSFSKRPPSTPDMVGASRGGVPSLPSTPDGRTVKQVGFQVPLETNNEQQQQQASQSSSSATHPEILVERCSPEEKSTATGNASTTTPPTSGDAQSTIFTGEQSLTDKSGEGCVISTSSGPPPSDCAINVDAVIINEVKKETDPVKKKPDGRLRMSPVPISGEDMDSPPNGNLGLPAEDEVVVDPECSSNKSEEIFGGGSCGVQPLVPTIHLKAGLAGGEAIDATRASSLSPHQSTLAVSELESAISELQSNGASRGDEVATPSTKRSKRNKLHFLRVETPTIWRTSSSLSLNGDVHILGTLSRSCSRLQFDADPVSDVEPSSSDSGAVSRCGVVKPLKLRLCQPFFGKKSSASNKARRDVLDMGKLPSPKVSSSAHNTTNLLN